jgi:glutamyl-tRNA reductase
MSMSRITTPYGAESIAAEVIEGLDLGGQRALITGLGGMAAEIARVLATAGAEVTLALRDLDAARASSR